VVDEFCHDDGLRLDTNSYRIFKVLNTSGRFEDHPQRIWNRFTLADKYNSFKDSQPWLTFQQNNPGHVISTTVFGECRCECIRQPTPEACVDVDMSGLVQEYMKALSKAIGSSQKFATALDEFDCPRHKQFQDHRMCSQFPELQVHTRSVPLA
jgi:hypothetical protein